MINIILRTSGRPNYFRKCLKSIVEQTYQHYRLWITVDDDYTEQYVKGYGLNYIKVNKNYPSDMDLKIMEDHPGLRYCGYNLYFNQVLDRIREGHIMYLDDDDMFYDNMSLETIAENLNGLVLWKVGFPGKTIPEPEYFGKKPEICHISGIGFAHPVTWRRWDCFNCGDFRFVDKLYGEMEPKWIDQVLTKLQVEPGFGGCKDIQKED